MFDRTKGKQFTLVRKILQKKEEDERIYFNFEFRC